MMSSPFNTPPTGKYQPPEPMSGVDESSEKISLFFSTEKELSIPSSQNGSLIASVTALNAIVENKLRGYEDRYQEYEISNAELQKRFNEKEAELEKVKREYEAKIANLKKEMTQVVDETKKKKWCRHCWNEITIVRPGPLVCSGNCLDAILATPVHSISSDSGDSSDDSMTEETMTPKNSSTTVNGPSENGVSKSALYQNGHSFLVNGSNGQLSKDALANSDDSFTPPDIASLIRTLEE